MHYNGAMAAVNVRSLLVWGIVLALVITYRNAIAMSLLPFLIAILAASLIEPPVTWLHQRARLSRGFASFILVLGSVLAGGTVLLLLVAAAAAQLVDLIGRLPAYREDLTAWSQAWLDWIDALFLKVPPSILNAIQANLQRLYGAAEAVALKGLTAVLNTAVAVPGALAVGLVATLATYFFAKDRDRLMASLGGLFPESRRRQLRHVQALVIGDVFRYLRAQLVLIAMTTAASIVGLWFIGVPSWLVMGVIGGALDLLPVVGPGLLYLPWALFSLFSGDVALGVGLLILFGVVSAVRQLFEARVIGASIGVHPLVTLFALYAGIVLFGLKGILLAPLLVILGKALVSAGVIRVPPPASPPD